MWSTAKTRNSYKDLINFFSTPGKPVDITEFGKFIRSLTADELDYYLTADLRPRESTGIFSRTGWGEL